MAQQDIIYAGAFADPVFASQSAFKALMNGMARPGSVQAVDATARPPEPMSAGAGALALTLCDNDTPVYLSAQLLEAGLPGWLAFQTGALVTDERTEAQFAFFDRGTSLPPLSTFCAGSQEYPDRSTTIILDVAAFGTGQDYLLAGPGIETEEQVNLAGLPAAFEDLWAANRALFPRGVDLILVAGSEIVCLPRTTRISKGKH